MPFSGGQRTGLQVTATPGRAHSFPLKGVTLRLMRFIGETLTLASMSSETIALASMANESIALSVLNDEDLEN